MVRVLHLCLESPDHVYGGMGVHVAKLCEALGCRVDLHLVTSADNYDSIGKSYTISHSPVPTYGATRKGRERIQEHVRGMTLEAIGHCCDVIHAHDWSAVQAALDVRSVTGVPVVCTFHLFQGQVWRVENYEWTNETALAVEMEGRGLHEADAVIVCSQQMRNFATGFYLCVRDIRIIPNAVDIAEIDEVGPQELATDRPVVLYCGRISKQKGIESLMDAIEQCDEFHWVILGGLATKEPRTEHEYDVRLRGLCERLPDRVTWMRHIDGPERFGWHKRADVGIMPSLCEPFGIAALEFFAAGCPLVHTGVDGLGEFATDDNSIVIPSASPDDIITGVRRALEYADELTPAARRTAEASTWDKVADQTVEVYKGVIENGTTNSSRSCVAG